MLPAGPEPHTENEVIFTTLPTVFYKSIAGGTNHSWVSKKTAHFGDGDINQFGQVGDGTSENKDAPVRSAPVMHSLPPGVITR